MTDMDVPQQYIKRMEANLEEALEDIAVHVFVMGPARDSDSAASELRRELIQRCKEYGYSAFLEHGEIIESVRAASRGADLAFIEETHAEGVHLLVFLPSSPGSFAELGFFAGLARGLSKGDRRDAALELIHKSVILLDAEAVPRPNGTRELTRGFVADGPALWLEDQGARVEYVSYADVEQVWALLQPRIESARRFHSTGNAPWRR